MFGLLEPMLIGAGVGALGSLVSGNSPFKGAALGAALGGGGAAIKGMMPSAFGLEGAKVATSQVPIENAFGNMMQPTLPEIGMANSFNLATNSPLPEVVGSSAMNTAPLISSVSPEMGGMMAQNSAEVMPSGFNLSEYLTPQNLQGAAMIAGQGERQQMPVAPLGGMRAGKPPSMDAISGLLASTRIPERQRLMNLFA